MILKIATEKGWKFSDNIRHLYVDNIGVNDYNEYKKKYNYTNLLKHTIKNDDSIVQTTLEVSHLKEIFLEGILGGDEIWLTDSETYIMTDEGKTIERIN